MFGPFASHLENTSGIGLASPAVASQWVRRLLAFSAGLGELKTLYQIHSSFERRQNDGEYSTTAAAFGQKLALMLPDDSI